MRLQQGDKFHPRGMPHRFLLRLQFTSAGVGLTWGAGTPRLTAPASTSTRIPAPPTRFTDAVVTRPFALVMSARVIVVQLSRVAGPATSADRRRCAGQPLLGLRRRAAPGGRQRAGNGRTRGGWPPTIGAGDCGGRVRPIRAPAPGLRGVWSARLSVAGQLQGQGTCRHGRGRPARREKAGKQADWRRNRARPWGSNCNVRSPARNETAARGVLQTVEFRRSRVRAARHGGPTTEHVGAPARFSRLQGVAAQALTGLRTQRGAPCESKHAVYRPSKHGPRTTARKPVATSRLFSGKASRPRV